MKKGIKFGAAAILAISALTPVAAFAAESTVQNGVYTSYGEGFYTTADFAKLPASAKKAIFADAKAAIVANGVAYNLQSDIAMKTDSQIDAITTTVEEYEAAQDVTFNSGTGFDGVVEPVTVESVNALEATVFKGSAEAQTLTFEINNGEKVSLKDLTDSGYTVEFIASAAVLDNGTAAATKNNTGKLKLTGSSADFTYVVKITKDGENPIFSDDTEVKVVNATDIKEITKFEVFDGATKLDTITKTDGDLTLKISEYVQADGTSVTIEDEANFKEVDSSYKVVSSNRGVLNPLVSGNLKIMNNGQATITVSKNDVVLGSTSLKVEADARVATTATAADVKLSKANSPQTVKVTVKDQYGNAIATDTYLHAAKADENAIVTVAGKELTAIDGKQGTDTVYISTSEDAENTEARIGSFKVTVEKAGIVVSHDVEVIGKTTIDANADVDAEKKSFDAKIAAKDSKGVVSEYLDIVTATSEDTAVATATAVGKTATITAVGTGSTKVTLVSTDGVTKTITVNVIDTTAPVVTVDNGSTNLLGGNTTDNNIEFTYTDEKSTVFGNSGQEIKFNFGGQAVQLKTATVAGVPVSDEVLYEAISYTEENFLTDYVESVTIKADKFNPTIEGALALIGGNEIVVTVANEAGIESTYTVKYTQN